MTDSLRRVFFEGFFARDIAEPLASFDSTTEIAIVKRFMFERPLSVVGIRKNGLVCGYIEQGEVDDRPLTEQMRPLVATEMVATTTPLHDVIASLESTPFRLVASLGHPCGIIRRVDFEKPPMRMWLFGMVTLFESTLTRIISDHFEAESWSQLLSESRVAKARTLQSERQRRNQSVRLLDCLQLGDKGQLIARSQDLREKYWNRSRRQIEKAVKEIESLRNNLAHSQPLVDDHWDVIVRISMTLDRLLEIPGELVAPSSLNPYNQPPADFTQPGQDGD